MTCTPDGTPKLIEKRCSSGLGPEARRGELKRQPHIANDKKERTNIKRTYTNGELITSRRRRKNMYMQSLKAEASQTHRKNNREGTDNKHNRRKRKYKPPKKGNRILVNNSVNMICF